LNPNIPPDVVELLRTAVHTYEALDALLLIRRCGNPLPPAEVARGLGIETDVAQSALDRLADVDVIEKRLVDGATNYGGVREPVRPIVDQLADAYRDHRLDVVVAMNNFAVERLRSGALRAFADAFVIRRKDG